MVTIRRGLLPDQIAPAARLYWEAFGGKLGTVMGPEPRALRFVALAMQPDHCFSATGPDGRLLGIAGFKSPFGAFVGGHSRDLRAAYGVLGAVWRSAALWTLSHQVDNHRFLIDGISVTREARGQGIGSALLQALYREGRERGYPSIRLEVVDTNWRARALYERQGFVPVQTERMGPLWLLFGFSAATTMVRPLADV
jgi:ribosomal protein S18 acetylase RimI-like enzyme